MVGKSSLLLHVGRNGGHMVPETQPERGYALFTRFISKGHLYDNTDIDDIMHPQKPAPTPDSNDEYADESDFLQSIQL
jgi:hypothetical protein